MYIITHPFTGKNFWIRRPGHCFDGFYGVIKYAEEDHIIGTLSNGVHVFVRISDICIVNPFDKPLSS